MFSVVFFFKQKTAYEMRISDWSSDVCSSDLISVAKPSWLRATLPLPGSGSKSSLPPPPGSVVPVPDSATLACAWSGSFELMASVPEKLPAAVGAKRSWTWQLAPGDRVPQSCPMTLKGAAGATTCQTHKTGRAACRVKGCQYV